MVVTAAVAPVVAMVVVVAAAEAFAGMHQRCGGFFRRVDDCGLGGWRHGDGQEQDQKRHSKYRGLFHGVSDGVGGILPAATGNRLACAF